MFRNNYQGGAVVEIFSGQGKDPVAKWKLSGGASAIHKEYNKEVKGFVYCLEGSSQTVKMQMPENGKMSLGLLQRYLVLQVNIPPCKDFSIELAITDSEHLKRRLHLSTVHKELSATLLHAKIPFVGLKRDIWSTLCIDLVSFTAELFKGFLTLDGITLFATCKVRRIFTMKTEPTGTSADDMFLSGAGLTELIPRSCQFPPDVKHVTHMMNMANLHKAEMRTNLVTSDVVPDQPGTARSSSYRRTRPQGVSHPASGSRASGPPPPTGRKGSAASDRMNNSALSTSDMESPSIKMNQKVSAEPSGTHHEGPPGSLQPHPPKDKQNSKNPRVVSAGRERLASSDVCSFSCQRETSRAASTPAETLSYSSGHGSSSDQRVCSSWECNEGPEPQLTLQEEVFTFSSQPHSPKRVQGQGDQEKVEVVDDQVQSRSRRRHEAQPEDDFVGSESDEDKSYSMFQHQRTATDSNTATPRSPGLTLNTQLDDHVKSHNMHQTSPKELSAAATSFQSSSSETGEPASMVPTHCLSPTPTSGRQCGLQGSQIVTQVLKVKDSVSLSRRLLQEVKLDNFQQHKDEEDDETLKADDSSHYGVDLLGSLQMDRDDDEELQMLASLKREQEEDECRASGLSASQIHQCNVSISVSSDDTSTWTHISLPANQGHHYQNEMNPLLRSNPREWMDVLSPPIMPPSQHRRSDSTWNNQENLVRGEDEPVKEDENEEEYLNLFYDPCLNCYFDPKTGKYYELA
ncbi:hypothetical protein Q5P01_001566 [Channa striata]|uniref:CFA20 domain-containing protein n=1 Tax=Channa striata TaxID=64152 RepID=A0AA88NRP9_CHASR|nr:hypothetical protein Q5P01_001566 [Channa striata]